MLLLNNLIRLNFNKFSRFSDPNFVIKKMLTAAHIKIFMNFSQTITILTSLNLNYVTEFSVNENIFSFSF